MTSKKPFYHSPDLARVAWAQPHFAPVVPLKIAKILQEKGYLGSYHLLLAHDVLEHPEEYHNIYANKGYIILMDNSLVELGYALPIDKVIAACRIVGAQYAILPDKLLDAQATESMIQRAIQEWHNIPTHARLGIELLAVLQGSSENEIMALMESLTNEIYIQGVCIPRVIADTFGTRSYIIQQVANYFKMHLLGFSNNLMDDIACARMPNVIGIDSAVPIRLGLRDKYISLDSPQDAGLRECYWDNPFELAPSALTFESRKDFESHFISRICVNVAKVRNWLHKYHGAYGVLDE